MVFIIFLLDITDLSSCLLEVTKKHISVAFSLNFRHPVLNGAFCSANSESRQQYLLKSFQESKVISLSLPLPSSHPFFFFGQFSVRKPLYFYPQKKLFIRLGIKEGFLAAAASGIWCTGLRLIKWLIFIWYFPPWETQKHFFFFNLSFKKKPAQLAYDGRKKQDTGTLQSRLELR